jgi:hypothetical protein
MSIIVGRIEYGIPNELAMDLFRPPPAGAGAFARKSCKILLIKNAPKKVDKKINILNFVQKCFNK